MLALRRFVSKSRPIRIPEWNMVIRYVKGLRNTLSRFILKIPFESKAKVFSQIKPISFFTLHLTYLLSDELEMLY